jgi:hypothetical protein
VGELVPLLLLGTVGQDGEVESKVFERREALCDVVESSPCFPVSGEEGRSATVGSNMVAVKSRSTVSRWTSGPAFRFRPRLCECNDQNRCSEHSRHTRRSVAVRPAFRPASASISSEMNRYPSPGSSRCRSMTAFVR